MTNVHIRVKDSASNRPTPVRLCISDPAGKTYPPLGRLAEFATGRNEDVGGHLLLNGKHYCYIDGSCEAPLPAGIPLTFDISKGPEYSPVRQVVTLGPGQMALRFAIERWRDQHAAGWYTGDTRCHFLSPHAALLEAQAEDLAVVQLLATEIGLATSPGKVVPAIPNMIAFSGQQPALTAPASVVAVNTLNRHPVLGMLALLHCHRAVYPLSVGGADATDDWSLADWCDQCHRKKGLVVWAEAFESEAGIAPEALADLILGRIDAVECTSASARLRDWYRAWSAGLRFALAGASAKDSNRTALGAMRTYAHVSAEMSFMLSDWIEAVRAGRTFVTSGPMLQFTVDGQLPGALLDRGPGAPPLKLRASVESSTPPGQLEIVANGEAIASAAPASAPPYSAEVEFEHDLPAGGWLAARCLAAPTTDGFAHTSPVFVRSGGRLLRDAELCRKFGEQIGSTIDWVNAHGRFEVPRRKEALLALLEEARQKMARVEA